MSPSIRLKVREMDTRMHVTLNTMKCVESWRGLQHNFNNSDSHSPRVCVVSTLTCTIGLPYANLAIFHITSSSHDHNSKNKNKNELFYLPWLLHGWMNKVCKFLWSDFDPMYALTVAAWRFINWQFGLGFLEDFVRLSFHCKTELDGF